MYIILYVSIMYTCVFKTEHMHLTILSKFYLRVSKRNKLITMLEIQRRLSAEILIIFWNLGKSE